MCRVSGEFRVGTRYLRRGIEPNPRKQSLRVWTDVCLNGSLGRGFGVTRRSGLWFG